MTPLGGFEAPPLEVRALGNTVFWGILLLAALLERLQHRLKADEGAHWWVSNGRDVINAFALAAVAAGLFLLGFHGPLVLLLAGTLVVSLTGLQNLWGNGPGAWLGACLSACTLGAPMVLMPSTVAEQVTRWVLEVCP
ncbi:MAG: hypothetical protein ACKVPX_00710 [Myxococcaceae bacterium]